MGAYAGVMAVFHVKRVYDDVDQADGYRVLVDRIWPRGLSKEAAHIDEWDRDVAPSTELRRWFGHDPARAQEFSARYRRELEASGAAAALAARLRDRSVVTLLYAAKDREHNNAVVLCQLLATL